jgi:hypothetical protein
VQEVNLEVFRVEKSSKRWQYGTKCLVVGAELIMLTREEVLKKSAEGRKEKSVKSVWKSSFVTRSMTVTKDKIGSEMHIIERSNSEKFLKTNSATRSTKVSEAKLGSRRHEDEAFSEKSKNKTSLNSLEVRSILGKKEGYKLRASTVYCDEQFYQIDI